MSLFFRTLGSFFLLCGIAPLFYRVFNFGTGVLCLLGAFLLSLPWLWPFAMRFTPTKALLIAGLAGLIAYSASISAMMAYKAWFDEPPETGPAVVVVLGAKVNGDQPSLMLRRRLNRAYDYLAANPEATCVVTGGQGPDEDYPEARIMNDYLVGRGVEQRRIAVEDASTSTRENLRFAAGHIEDGVPAVIVTDSFHQMRAFIFARAELGREREYHALSSLTPWGLFPSYWVRDMFGIAVAWLQTGLGI